MENKKKIIPIDDLIAVNSLPESINDENCFTLYYKETGDNKREIKINTFKMVTKLRFTKSTMIERLKLNINKIFSFDHLKINDEEISPQEFLRENENKNIPKNINLAITIIYYLLFYKNINYFLNILRKYYGSDNNNNDNKRNNILENIENKDNINIYNNSKGNYDIFNNNNDIKLNDKIFESFDSNSYQNHIDNNRNCKNDVDNHIDNYIDNYNGNDNYEDIKSQSEYKDKDIEEKISNENDTEKKMDKVDLKEIILENLNDNNFKRYHKKSELDINEKKNTDFNNYKNQNEDYLNFNNMDLISFVIFKFKYNYFFLFFS